MGTKIKFQPTKTKLKYDTKAGDRMNIDLQGYIKHKDVLSGKPFKGSKIKATTKYKKGRHGVSGEAVYKPGSKEGSIRAKYTYSFKKGGKI